MSYNTAMEAAGAKVHEFERFGSYQGDWVAKVEFEGKEGFVQGYYGSCSGCDAFEGEFGWSGSHYHGDEYVYSDNLEKFDPECNECVEFKTKLVEFGKEYLETIMTCDEAIKKASENIEWDMDAQEMVKWVEAHK